MGVFVIVVVLLVVVATVVSAYVSRPSFGQPLVSQHSPAETLAFLIQHLVIKGCVPVHESAGEGLRWATLSRRINPNFGVGCILLLLGLLPGILYFLFAGGNVQVTIMTRLRASGTGSEIILSGDDSGAKAETKHFIRKKLSP